MKTIIHNGNNNKNHSGQSYKIQRSAGMSKVLCTNLSRYLVV